MIDKYVEVLIRMSEGRYERAKKAGVDVATLALDAIRLFSVDGDYTISATEVQTSDKESLLNQALK